MLSRGMMQFYNVRGTEGFRCAGARAVETAPCGPGWRSATKPACAGCRGNARQPGVLEAAQGSRASREARSARRVRAAAAARRAAFAAQPLAAASAARAFMHPPDGTRPTATAQPIAHRTITTRTSRGMSLVCSCSINKNSACPRLIRLLRRVECRITIELTATFP